MLCRDCGLNPPYSRYKICQQCRTKRGKVGCPLCGNAMKRTSTSCRDCNAKARRHGALTRTSKSCSICHTAKDLKDFHKDKRSLDGHSHECKGCNSKRSSTWRSGNSLQKAAYDKAYKAANKAKTRRWSQARRARARVAFIQEFTDQELYDRLSMFHGLCGICNKTYNPLDFHVDHVKPLYVGGKHCLANLQPAHPTCNVRKGWKFIPGRRDGGISYGEFHV